MNLAWCIQDQFFSRWKYHFLIDIGIDHQFKIKMQCENPSVCIKKFVIALKIISLIKRNIGLVINQAWYDTWKNEY